MSHIDTLDVTLPAPEDTDRLGAAFAAALNALHTSVVETGFALRLEGDLGAGKTSLMRALLRAMNYGGAVKSPTFSLLETYDMADFTVNHFDFYRFEEATEFEDAGFRDQYGPGQFSASEWSEKAAPYLPPADLIVTLSPEGFGRRAHLEAHTPAGIAFLTEANRAWTAAA